MNRDYKGHSVNDYVKDYCVVDLETTSKYSEFAKIVEISALKVRNNEVVEEFSMLVNPQCHIPNGATMINKITDDMVCSAPVIDDVICRFIDFVEDDVLVGYNIAAFDINVLYDCVENVCNRHLSNDYIDVLHAVKRTIDSVENYRLSTLCEYFAIDTTNCHRALKDCYMTKSCYDRVYEQYGDMAFHKMSDTCGCGIIWSDNCIGRKGYLGIPFSNKTCKQRELIDMLKKMLNDNTVSTEEAENLQYWLYENSELSTEYPFDKLFAAISEMIEDNEYSLDELQKLKELAEQLIDPVESYCCSENIQSLDNLHVCLTGDFEYGDKDEVNKLIEQANGIVDESIRKRDTKILVVGAKGSPLWKTGNYGNKVQTAIGMIEAGKSIRIMKENTFIPMVKCIIECKRLEKEQC